MKYGQGDHVYELDAAWGQLPRAGSTATPSASASIARTASTCSIAAPTRSSCSIAPARILGSWGEGVFTTPHGLDIVDDAVYCVDAGDHTVRVFSLDGQLRLTLGTPDVPAATGWAGQYDDLPGGPPFFRPTNVAIGSGGDIYVSDGYANCKVHRFSREAFTCSRGARPGAARAVSAAARRLRRTRRVGEDRRPPERPGPAVLRDRRLPR